jgi:hypothetical protein
MSHTVILSHYLFLKETTAALSVGTVETEKNLIEAYRPEATSSTRTLGHILIIGGLSGEPSLAFPSTFPLQVDFYYSNIHIWLI